MSAQKILIAVALAVLLGTVAYQAHQNMILRRQMEAVQQQQEPLTQRNEFLETELRSLNRLADANQKFQRDTIDLLRLRAKNARLKSIGGQQAKASGQTVAQEATATEAASPEASFNEEQKQYLAEMTVNIKTKNSVADLDRLRDTLARWDELSANMVAPKMAAVIPALKQLVVERVAELEKEASQK